MIRNVFGVLSMLVTGGVVLRRVLVRLAEVQAAFAYAGVWFLLLGGVRPVVELQRLRSRGRLPDSDADQLARLTRLPGLFWVGLFGVVNLLALLAGAGLLAGRPSSTAAAALTSVARPPRRAERKAAGLARSTGNGGPVSGDRPSGYSGMLPCFFGGRVSRLVRSGRSAADDLARGSRDGGITAST